MCLDCQLSCSFELWSVQGVCFMCISLYLMCTRSMWDWAVFEWSVIIWHITSSISITSSSRFSELLCVIKSISQPISIIHFIFPSFVHQFQSQIKRFISTSILHIMSQFLNQTIHIHEDYQYNILSSLLHQEIDLETNRR